MILNDQAKVPLPNDPTPSDAPPAYDDISRPTVSSPLQDVKSPLPSTSSEPTSPSRPVFSSGTSQTSPPPSSFKGGLKSGFSWWTSGPTREVKSTVQALIRDLIKPSSNVTVPAVLESCENACATHGCSFSALLQEKYIEGHTPLYWAIINNHSPNHPPSPEAEELINGLFKCAAPLTPTTLDEARLSCLITDDQKLFSQLQRYLRPLTGADNMVLLGAEPDSITFTPHPDGVAAFAVSISISLFQKRMLMGHTIPLEFIARSRIWRLEFFIDTTGHTSLLGNWYARITLMEHSSPTWLDSQLLIEAEGKPTLSMRMKSSFSQMVPKESLVVMLDQEVNYVGSPYIRPDGTLKARLEAQLVKPGSEGECIIC